jgi:hypothetical protein
VRAKISAICGASSALASAFTLVITSLRIKGGGMPVA